MRCHATCDALDNVLLVMLRLALGIALLAPLALAPRRQDERNGDLVLRCDAARSWLHLGDTTGALLPRDSLYASRTIAWGALIKAGPGTNPHGDPLRTGTRTITRKCGALTVRVSAGFLNPNVQGELGAVEFPVVSVLAGSRLVLPRTALASCEQGPGRYEAFAPCPAGWATAVTVQYDPRTRATRRVAVRTYMDSTFREQMQGDTVLVR